MEAHLLLKSEPDLRGDGKGTYTLVLADIWELSSSGCNRAFTPVALPGCLLTWESEFLGPNSSLTYLQPSGESYTPGFSFPSLGWGRVDFLQNICSRLNLWAICLLIVAEDAEAASGGPGAVTVCDVPGSWAQDWEWYTTWQTAAVTPRALEALSTGTYHHLGSVGWDQVVRSYQWGSL